MTDTITTYPDGRWTVGDHPADGTDALWCRGNVGEVFPNVVTPLSASLYRGAMDRGQVAAAREWGMLTDTQVASLVPDGAWLTGVFGGYLYGNVTAARSAVARTPGLTVELVDTQMFGLSDAPPHRRQPGERDARAALRSGRKVLSARRAKGRARLVP